MFLGFGSVYHTSIYEKSALKIFKNIKFFVKYLIIDQTIYCEQIYTMFLNHLDNYCWQYHNGLMIPQ